MFSERTRAQRTVHSDPSEPLPTRHHRVYWRKRKQQKKRRRKRRRERHRKVRRGEDGSMQRLQKRRVRGEDGKRDRRREKRRGRKIAKCVIVKRIKKSSFFLPPSKS